MSIQTVIERAFSQCQADRTDEEVKVIHLAEEAGEVFKAWRKERGHKEGVPDEPTTHECVDTIICAINVFLRMGGTIETFETIMNKKLDKSKKKMKEKGWL